MSDRFAVRKNGAQGCRVVFQTGEVIGGRFVKRSAGWGGRFGGFMGADEFNAVRFQAFLPLLVMFALVRKTLPAAVQFDV